MLIEGIAPLRFSPLSFSLRRVRRNPVGVCSLARPGRILGAERGLLLRYLARLCIFSAFAKKAFGTRADLRLLGRGMSRAAKQNAAVLTNDHSGAVVWGVRNRSSALGPEKGPRWPVSHPLSVEKSLQYELLASPAAKAPV